MNKIQAAIDVMHRVEYSSDELTPTTKLVLSQGEPHFYATDKEGNSFKVTIEEGRREYVSALPVAEFAPDAAGQAVQDARSSAFASYRENRAT